MCTPFIDETIHLCLHFLGPGPVIYHAQRLNIHALLRCVVHSSQVRLLFLLRSSTNFYQKHTIQLESFWSKPCKSLPHLAMREREFCFCRVLKKIQHTKMAVTKEKISEKKLVGFLFAYFLKEFYLLLKLHAIINGLLAVDNSMLFLK